MKKINFVNKKAPSMSAAILNELQDNFENEFYYKDGDTYQINAIVGVGGWLTGSSTTVSFSIFVPKSLKNINSITVNSFDITARHITGGYALNRQKTGTIKVVKSSENAITFEYTHDTALSVTNNTPIAVAIYGMKLTFNETSAASEVSVIEE